LGGRGQGRKLLVWGVKRSEETRAKMSASQMGNSKAKKIKIEVTDLELKTSTIYNSMSAGARALNIRQSTISNYFDRNQKKPLNGRYVFIKR
jgi:hypothetical protein